MKERDAKPIKPPGKQTGKPSGKLDKIGKVEKDRKQKMLSAGIIPVFRSDENTSDLYLLLRCYNYWDFPKGGVQTGETPIQAALRELQEETTLEKADFVWGEDFRETPVYAQGKVARFYVGRVHRQDVSLPVNPFIGRPEHHEFRWVNYETARKLLHPRVKPILDWARELTGLPVTKKERIREPAASTQL